MFGTWFSPVFAIEAQQVVLLRTLKVLAGGAAGRREALAMVTEKIAEAQYACGSLALGATAEAVARRYRARVRANLKRLSRPAGRRRKK